MNLLSIRHNLNLNRYIIYYGLSQEHNSPYVCNETHELPDQYWVDGHLYLK